MEASHRPKQTQDFSTRRKVQNGNSRVHQDLPDSRGVGIVDRSVRRLPTHPHPPKLKEMPKVLLQVSGVPVHLPPIRTSHSPPGLYNDCKESETNGPLKRTQNSPIPGRLADQVPVSGGSPSGRPNPVLGVDNKSEKIRTETYSGVFIRGLRVPSKFSPCKTIAAHLDWWQNPSNVMKGADLHPKDHSIQLFTDASNEGWGAHLDQNSTKGLWSDREKRLHINVLELKTSRTSARTKQC